MARKRQLEVIEGEDPGAEKISKRRSVALTFDDAFEEFALRHISKMKTARETHRIFERYANPQWKKRALKSIERAELISLLDEIADNSAPIMANRTLAALRKFFNWCVARDYLAQSPATGVVKPSREISRERVLNDDEIQAFWIACKKMNGQFGALFRFLILTGQRRNEALTAEWRHFDLNDKIWIIPAELRKTSQEQSIPLSELMITLLGDIERFDGGRLLFPSIGSIGGENERPISGISRAKKRIDGLMAAELGVNPKDLQWRIHDLRRTLATNLQKLGVRLEVTEAVLGHASGSRAGLSTL